MSIFEGCHARLKKDLARLGISQIQAAAETDVSRAAMQNYVNGSSPLTSSWLSRYEAIGGDVRYVLFAEGTASARDELWLIENYRRMPEAMRGLALRFIGEMADQAADFKPGEPSPDRVDFRDLVLRGEDHITKRGTT